MRNTLYAAMAVFLFLSVPPAFAEDGKPNIILIVSDDTGYGDLGPYGAVKAAGCRRPTSIGYRRR